MQRLRKKSDPSRPPPVLHSSFFSHSSEDEQFPGLPSADAFRTSLILPELTRRFTFLRTSSGNPVSLVDLRLKFAEQRARGAPNQITVAEEDMILQTLGRIRSRHTASTSQGDINTSIVSETGAESDYNLERSSHLSSNTASTTYPASSITSSPRSTKRYSNNLFSSGRLRDYGYLRAISQKAHRSAVSITHTESSQSLREETSLNSIESLRPTTPDGGGSASPSSSPNDKTPVARTTSLISSNEDLPQSSVDNGSGLRISKRASAALAQVIKELEEEAEDEIVMPRTAHPTPRPSDSDHSRVMNDTQESVEPGASPTYHRSSFDYEAGTAISSDGEIIMQSDTRQLSLAPYDRPGTVSPTPRLPGYIPGMPRPMTPRESSFDTEDIRSHSTTPRASPPIPIANGQSAHIATSSISSSLLRRSSDASRSTPRPTSPQTHAAIHSYLSRSNSGRRTPDAQRDSTSGTEQEGSVTSSVFIRRRPVSPLSGPAFQPMVVSPRPSTPSNITWTVGASASPEKARVKSESRSTHSRSGSQSTETDFQTNTDRSKSPTRSLRSSVPPESPGPAQTTYASKWNNSASPADSRAASSLSTYDFGSTPSTGSRGLRSPTPTQTRNAASPTFPSSDSNSIAARSSKQHFKSPSNYSYGVSQLSLSPIVNSSRSSLESTGSSYHSSEPSQRVGGALDIFSGSSGQTPSTWYGLDKSVSLTPGSSQEECDFEGIIRRYAGLTKSDFVAIQEKLVGAALHKAALPDTRERTNSLRRRRPSTSQSNYSTNGRVMSPTPTQTSPAGRRSPALDNNAKASALLESVVDSIPITDIETKVEGNTQPEISPTTRRNRDLARALGFGNGDSDHLVVPQMSDQDSSSTSVSPTVEAILPPEFPQDVESILPLSARQARFETSSSPSPLPQRSQSLRNPRSTPIDQTDLAREVQRRADAATAALMKSPIRNFTDVNASTISVSRKKIDPSQISEPRLLTAPTSVETIPLPAPTSPPSVSPQPSFGITQRMRRFRNTLRVKPTTPSGEEVTPFPLDVQPQSAPASQGLNRRPTLPLPRFGPGSSTELAKLKTPSASPAASAAPGLKGLMARFRKPRTIDSAGDSQSSMHSRTSPTTSSPTASSHQGHARGNVSSSVSPTATIPQSGDASVRPSLDASAVLVNDVNSAAVKQLFEAASKIGLDQAALNDLVTRSTSVSRAAGWVWSGGSSSTIGNTPLTPSTQPSSILDRSRLAPPADKPSNGDDPSNGADGKSVRKLSVRKAGEPGQIRQNPQIPENAAVIRRTLIFPSEFRSSKVDLSQVNRKSLVRRHRRSGSATSAQSARSVHDRAPTPPPPKANGGRRFSSERPPPVPGAATSIGAQAEVLLRAPPSNAAAEKPSSAYDSLYDMYSGESKHASAVVDDAGTDRDPDGTAVQEGPAVEVIEMANGETIWQIIDSLRDDDVDSVYPSRTSMGSNHSTSENGDGVQLFVKAHVRPTLKGGGSSINPRKRSSQSKHRPETKVFYSSSAQIGRLIENLSQGMDAGSFNFIFNQPPDYSSASSFHSDADMQWTVEERLEHMLGAINS
ncbi:hypothetical protein J3R82DRAFT_6061 [Butyriboletus roseoflavus]|nr:hypothetical protein J3R82DRAFT_6061 [Butyriboletus roseoflavus]